MNRILILSVFILGNLYLGFSQQKNENSKLISGRWSVVSMDTGEERVDFSEGNNWMEFSTNGLYHIRLNAKRKVGTWQLSESDNKIEFDGDDFDGSTIIKKLNDKEFLFSIIEGKDIYTMVLKK